jgi:hypothetical protein
MAYAPFRSRNAELCEGATDSKYNKIVQDRGGFVEDATYAERKMLPDVWYAFHEAAEKIPAGRTRPVRTPNTVATPEPKPYG